MQVTFTEYHSIQWSLLVEMGFITMDVERDAAGKLIARMGRAYTVRLTEAR